MPDDRRHQIMLIASTSVGCWLGMQAVHELGHVVGAWLTDGEVACVVLHPLSISRTDLAHNPSPLLVVWAGPIVGIAAPLLLWTVASRLRSDVVRRCRFIILYPLHCNIIRPAEQPPVTIQPGSVLG